MNSKILKPVFKFQGGKVKSKFIVLYLESIGANRGDLIIECIPSLYYYKSLLGNIVHAENIPNGYTLCNTPEIIGYRCELPLYENQLNIGAVFSLKRNSTNIYTHYDNGIINSGAIELPAEIVEQWPVVFAELVPVQVDNHGDMISISCKEYLNLKEKSEQHKIHQMEGCLTDLTVWADSDYEKVSGNTKLHKIVQKARRILLSS